MEAPGRLLLLVLLAALAFAVGILAEFWWTRARARRRVPRQLELTSRRMANSREWKTWRWLLDALPDQYIMIKVPVTRFTLPRTGSDRRRVHELLSGVYCTFTVCSPDGQVIGCVDVPGSLGLPQSNRELKRRLLTQCGIPYWVIRNGKFPDPGELRADLLGQLMYRPQRREQPQAELDAAKQKLREALDRRRHQREGHGIDSIPSEPSPDSMFASGHWEQPNSFLVPLDSA